MVTLNDDQVEEYETMQSETIEAMEDATKANRTERDDACVYSSDDHVNLDGVWYVKDFPKLRKLLDCVEEEHKFLASVRGALKGGG